MKRKKAGRKTRKKPPAISAGLLSDLFSGNKPPDIPSREITWWIVGDDGSFVDAESRPRTEISGAPLPPDLDKAVKYFAGRNFRSLEEGLTRPPWTYFGEENESDYPDWKEADIPPDGWRGIRRCLEDCFREGFFLAVMRYAEDLKRSAEAAPLIEGLKKAARKGAAARRSQAAPTRKAVCKRFREMRKTTPKKTVRYLRVAEEFGMSERHVQRIVSEAGIE